MNIIHAIINLVNHPETHIRQFTQGNNRANNMGNALEEYIKDLFANSFTLNHNQRHQQLSNVFSYLGNTNNPPDAMLHNGDAIEVKKIESPNSALALNSSYPKQKLTYNNPMIAQACKQAEKNWVEKDIIYCVGMVQNQKLKHLCMVYGLDYCANEECYLRIKNTIKNGIESIAGVTFSETKELGRVNRIDPLGISYLRVRGMWGIENPWQVFHYIYTRPNDKQFDFMCLINLTKWNSFTNTHDLLNLSALHTNLHIKDVQIQNPDNPAQLRNAKLITFSI